MNFNKKTIYYKQKMLLNKGFIEKRVEIINKYAYNYNLDRNKIYGILLLEHINRGSWITRKIEKIAVKILPLKLIEYFNPSLGIGQIKVGTAKNIYPEIDIKILAKNLLIDEFNIHICAQIIHDYYYSLQNEEKNLLGLVKQYTTGNVNSVENTSINLYYSLLEWSIEKTLISQ